MSGGRGIGSRASYPGIDVAKLLMAFVVVEIHARPFGLLDGLVGALLVTVENVAVPFFFIASGFLCFRGLSENDIVGRDAPKAGRARRTALRLLRLYATWLLLFVPVSAFGSWLSGWGVVKSVAMWLRGALLVGETVFSWPLWYLLAAAVGFGLVYLMLGGGLPPRRILAASFLVMLGGWGISVLHSWDGMPVWASASIAVYYKLFVNVRNGLFLGFFYVALGMVTGLRLKGLRRLGPVAPCAALVAGFAGCLVVSADQHLPFCALAAWGLFALSARRVSAGRGFVFARNTSTVVYLTHMFFVVIFTYGVFGGAGASIYAADVPHAAVFVCSLACALVLAAAVVPLSRRHPKLAKVFGL